MKHLQAKLQISIIFVFWLIHRLTPHLSLCCQLKEQPSIKLKGSILVWKTSVEPVFSGNEALIQENSQKKLIILSIDLYHMFVSAAPPGHSAGLGDLMGGWTMQLLLLPGVIVAVPGKLRSKPFWWKASNSRLNTLSGHQQSHCGRWLVRGNFGDASLIVKSWK